MESGSAALTTAAFSLAAECAAAAPTRLVPVGSPLAQSSLRLTTDSKDPARNAVLPAMCAHSAHWSTSPFLACATFTTRYEVSALCIARKQVCSNADMISLALLVSKDLVIYRTSQAT